jgi:hypothetical protein
MVMISNAPSARPVIGFEELAHQVHAGLVAAGGDPVGYFELEDVVLNEEIQAAYAEQFNKRLIKGIVVVTRKPEGSLEVNIAPFTQNKSIVNPGTNWSLKAADVKELKERLELIGQQQKSKNLLVLEIPEFLAPSEGGTRNFLTRNPLNLDVFKLGVPLGGAGGESSFLTSFRYDLLGKSDAERQRAQETEKNQLQAVLESLYPHQVEFLTEPKTNQELIRDRVQFLLMRVEGREGDLMRSMGVKANSSNPDRVVVKYFIRFLVRDEQYIGPQWDADPDWRKALTNFLENLRP